MAALDTGRDALGIKGEGIGKCHMTANINLTTLKNVYFFNQTMSLDYYYKGFGGISKK